MSWFYLPVLIVVAANVTYDISSKSIPDGLNAYAGITITYSVLAVFNFLIFKIMNPEIPIIVEWAQINWAVVLFAFTSVGIESGYIFLFRAGWNISLGGMVCNTLLAVCMLLVGRFLFSETVSFIQLLGVILCVTGLIIINRAGFRKELQKEIESKREYL
jgi:drug/metabolite transporter (DMT)-like permease